MSTGVSGQREVAVVTGGASGFGLGLAVECAARGMDVALLDRDAERAVGEARIIANSTGVEAIGVGVDVASTKEVLAAAGTVEQRFGRADLVVSNVGVQLFGAIERLTEDEWRWVLDVNVTGAARTANAFVPLLRKAPNPRLAFTTSSSVLEPASRLGVYQASKFAVWGLAETLRIELLGEVKVTVVFPSGMISRHLETSTEAQPEHLRRDICPPEDFAAMADSNPGMVADAVEPAEAARRSIDGILAGEHYVVTHGDLRSAVQDRHRAVFEAATRASHTPRGDAGALEGRGRRPQLPEVSR